MRIGVDLDTVENDDPVVGFNQISLAQDAENVTVLGNGPRDSVKFEWRVTPWTECSQSCGPEIGYKVSLHFHSQHTHIIFKIKHIRIFIVLLTLMAIKIFYSFVEHNVWFDYKIQHRMWTVYCARMLVYRNQKHLKNAEAKNVHSG